MRVAEATVTAGQAFQDGADRAELALLNHPRLTDPQRAFASSMERFLAWIGGNSLGKTYGHAFDTVHYARGTHPFRKVPTGPRKLMLAGFSFAQMDPLMEKLWSMLPKGEIHPKLYYAPGQGIKGFKERVIPFIAGPGKGTTIHLATYEQGPARIMGFQGHRFGMDEPPPGRVYAEARPRLNFYRGEMRLTMTPTPESPPLEYLEEEIQLGKVKPMQTSYNEANITVRGGLIPFPWKRQVDIDEDIAGYLPDERPMREHGDFHPLVGGRWLERVTDENFTDAKLPRGSWFLCVAVDHGTRPGRQSATFAAANAAGDFWLIDEAHTGTVTTIDEDAANIAAMLERNGFRWEEIDHWVGDRATEKSFWGSAKSNKDLQQALAAFYGMSAREAATRGMRFTTIFKNSGSLRRGCALINTLAYRKRLHIRNACKGFKKFVKEWKGDVQDEIKDPGDSGRYCIETLYDRMDVPKVAPTGRID